MLSQRRHDRSQTQAPEMLVHKYVEEKDLVAMLATKRLVGVTPEVNLCENVTVHRLPSANKAAHSGFETQRRRHQKSKTWGISGPKNLIMDQCLCGHWNPCFGFLVSSVLGFKVRVDLLIAFHIFLSLVHHHWSREHCNAKIPLCCPMKSDTSRIWKLWRGHNEYYTFM